jgi:hypothetical protein
MAYPDFRRWEIFGCCGFKYGTECDHREPWLSLDGYAYDDEERPYSFDVSIRARFEEDLQDDVDPPVRLVPLAVQWTRPVWVTDGWTYPSVVVDGPWFDELLIDRLVFGHDDVRLAVFSPGLTHAEFDEWTLLDELVQDDLVTQGAAALVDEFGTQWRIEAGDAGRAAELLIEAGLLAVGPEQLFDAFPRRFSNTARRVIRGQLRLARPDHF